MRHRIFLEHDYEVTGLGGYSCSLQQAQERSSRCSYDRAGCSAIAGAKSAVRPLECCKTLREMVGYTPNFYIAGVQVTRP